MKKTLLIIAIGTVIACGSSAEDSDQEVTEATSEKIKEAQDVNVELEEIDGELDSLLNLLN